MNSKSVMVGAWLRSWREWTDRLTEAVAIRQEVDTLDLLADLDRVSELEERWALADERARKARTACLRLSRSVQRLFAQRPWALDPKQARQASQVMAKVNRLAARLGALA